MRRPCQCQSQPCAHDPCVPQQLFEVPARADLVLYRNTDPVLSLRWEPGGIPYDYSGNLARVVFYTGSEDAPLAVITDASGTYGQVTFGAVGTDDAGVYDAQIAAALTRLVPSCGCRYKAYVQAGTGGKTTLLLFGDVRVGA